MIDKEKVIADVITDLTKEGIKSIVSKIKETVVDFGEKDSIDYNYAYEKYLQVSSEKVRMVKTILYRKVPKDIYSIFECTNINYDGNEINTNNVNNILSLGHKIILTGTAGIGKTTLLRHLYLDTIKHTDLIPVFVELRSINAEETYLSVIDLIYNSLANCGFNVSQEHFKYSLESGKYVIFYDGFDEIKTEKSYSIAKEIRELSTKYNENYYIMTSRPLEQFIGWNDFLEMHSMCLNKKQALNLIKRLEYDTVAKEKFYSALENGLFEKYYSFASNPLLLNIMLLTFDERASIPDKLNDFYEQAFSTLFNVHDGSKDCFKRDIRTGLGSEDFKTIFSYFCFKTYFNSAYEFTENSVRYYLNICKNQFPQIQFSIDNYLEDLLKSVCMLVKDGLTYAFSHRSFQEYFAALYTTKLIDRDQAKLISSWLTEKKGSADDPYFLMLYNMQGDKFNKIILCEGLKKIKRLFDQHLFSMDFLKKLFENIMIRRVGTKENPRYHVSLIIKDHYLCSILRMTCLFNNFDFTSRDHCDEFIDYASLSRTIKDTREISFEQIIADGMGKATLSQLTWVEEQLLFSFNLLEKYSKKTTGNKKKVSSIIDSL